MVSFICVAETLYLGKYLAILSIKYVVYKFSYLLNISNMGALYVIKRKLQN